MSSFDNQLHKVRTQDGFIAALDQSGGSTPKALLSYGVEESEYSGDEEMFTKVHEMRTRIITSPAFNGDRILGAILFENTMDREICGKGILVDGEVVDVEVELYDGKFHAVDSDEGSFKKAGARAFRAGFEKAGPVLLEPVMKVLIRVPTADAGSIFSDITSQRRGHVLDQASEEDGAITVITAEVPLSTMQTYFRDLKSQTAGEGSYAMRLDHYGTVPSNEAQKIVAEMASSQDEE